MDEYQLEKAFQVLGQLQKLDHRSTKISSLIKLAEQKLEGTSKNNQYSETLPA